MLSDAQREFVETFITGKRAPEERALGDAEADFALTGDDLVPVADFEDDLALVGDDIDLPEGTGDGTGSAPNPSDPPPVVPQVPQVSTAEIESFQALGKSEQAARLVALGLPADKAAKLVDSPEDAAVAFRTLETIKAVGVPAGRAEQFLAMAEAKPAMFDSAMAALARLDPGAALDASVAGIAGVSGAVTDKVADFHDAREDYNARKKDFNEKHAAMLKAQQDAEDQKTADAATLANMKKAADDAALAMAQAEEHQKDVATRLKDTSDTSVSMTDYEQARDSVRAAKETFDRLKLAFDTETVEAETRALAQEAAVKTAIDVRNEAAKASNEALHIYKAADLARKQAESARQAVLDKADFLNLLAHGPLSTEAKPEVSEAQGKALLDAHGRNPALAKTAMALIAKGGDPAVITANLGPLLDKLDDGFKDAEGNGLPDTVTPKQRNVMVMNVLKAGATKGQAYFDGFFDYLKTGAQNRPDTCAMSQDELRQIKADPGAPGLSDAQKKDIRKNAANRRMAAISAKRTALLAGAMIDASGNLAMAQDPEALKTAVTEAEALVSQRAAELAEMEKYAKSAEAKRMPEITQQSVAEARQDHEKAVQALDKARKAAGDAEQARKETEAAQAHLAYHPGSLIDYTPQLNGTIEETVALFSNPKTASEAKAIIDATGTPNTAGKTVVARTLGKDPGAVDGNDAKAAVLSAMMTPMSQGPVGSCFSTGPVRKMRVERPLEMMASLSEVATTAMYTPKHGTTIPASTNAPPGENLLMRSVEYSAATAGASFSNSQQRRNLNAGLGRSAALGSLRRPLGISRDDWNGTGVPGPNGLIEKGLKEKVVDAVSRRLKLDYNADIQAAPGGGDGSSDSGGFQFMFDGKDRITSKAEFENAMIAICEDVLNSGKDPDKSTEIAKAVRAGTFTDAIASRFGTHSPWKMESGGLEFETVRAIEGGNPVRTEMTGKRAPGDASSEGDRTKALVKSFGEAMQGKSGMHPMGTSGDNCNHAFNALADDKMVAALRAPREDGSINVEEQIKDLMLKPGKAIADAKLPISEVQALYIKGIDAALNKRSGRNGRGMNVLKTAYANMPTVELTAQEVVDLIASQIDQLAAENFNADYLEELKKDCAGAVDAELLKTKDTPELVMADTNWGSSTSQTFFVVRTDPRTGELKQYIKKMPEGTLSDLPKNWKDGQWQRLEG